MIKYIGKRLLNIIPVFIIISMVIFWIINQMPGDPVDAYLGEGSQVSEEQQQQIKAQLGLDKPLPIQYLNWLQRVLTGDFGSSLIYRKPVSDIIGTYIWNTFLLNFAGIAVAFLISIPIGIKSAVKKYGAFDNFWTIFSLIGVSMPSFFFALLLIFLVAANVDWIPLNGMRTPLLNAMGYESTWHEIRDIAVHMILPVIVITLTSLASLTRYVRNAVIEAINQDYIRTARSKGLREKVVIYRHGFRNALLPIITLLGAYIPSLFGGAMILETVFMWPGIGNILFASIMNRDFSLVMAANVFYAVLMIFGNLLADISYALADPRIKLR